MDSQKTKPAGASKGGRTMNPAQKLRIVDRSLGVTMLLILASGIQLEATYGRYGWSVWLHIALGVALIALSVYHIFLHYRRSNWFARFARNPHTSTRVLWWTFLLTAATGIAATPLWLADGTHSHLGAIHGKIGFLMAIVAIYHALKRKPKHRNRRIRTESQEGKAY